MECVRAGVMDLFLLLISMISLMNDLMDAKEQYRPSAGSDREKLVHMIRRRDVGENTAQGYLDSGNDIDEDPEQLGRGVEEDKQVTCEAGGEPSPSGHKCFAIVPDMRGFTQEEVAEMCDQYLQGSHVAKPESNEELQFLHQTYSNPDLYPQIYGWWLDLTVPDGRPENVKWQVIPLMHMR